jgi:sirohydrochlorin cobaltochelatase
VGNIVTHSSAASMQAIQQPGSIFPGSEATHTGVLVVGHGTADPVGAEETREVARHTAAVMAPRPVELGFLEVIGPSIGDGMRDLVARGCQRVVVAPLLLFTAGHARRDVPEAVVEAAGRYHLAVTQAAALGSHSALLELARQRRREALAGLAPTAPADTVAVVLGRGSSAADGVAQFREWVVASLGDASGFHPDFEIGFAAAARPTLDEALGAAAARRPQRVVIQPHLLFRGHVENQVTEAVSRWRGICPQIEWVQVSRLGADDRVAQALVSRISEAANTGFRHDAAFSREKNLSPEVG